MHGRIPVPGKFPGARTRKDRRVLNRWIASKPHGKAGTSAHACASPAMPEALVAATDRMFDGSYGTRVSNGTKQGRPMGRGSGAG
jgi:hypothetical protein